MDHRGVRYTTVWFLQSNWGSYSSRRWFVQRCREKSKSCRCILIIINVLLIFMLGVNWNTFISVAQIEEQILESLAWKLESPLWETIKCLDGPLPSVEEVGHSSSFWILIWASHFGCVDRKYLGYCAVLLNAGLQLPPIIFFIFL